MNSLKDLSYRNLFFFSLPSILGTMVEVLAGMVDTGFIGRINTQWLAALSVSTIILSSSTWMFNFLIHSSTQGIGDAYNKGPFVLGERIKISLCIGSVVGLGVTLILYFSRSFLYSLVGGASDLIPLINEYFTIRLYGQPALILLLTILSILRGMGFIRSSFWIIFAISFTNISLNWYFLFIVKMGISGAAWGTTISNFLGIFVALFYLAKKINFFSYVLVRTEKLSGEWFEFGQKSLNLFFRSVFLSSCFFLSTSFASRLGVEILAAHHVMMQLWLFSSYLIDGVAITGNVLGSQYLTTKKLKRLKFMAYRILGLGGFMGLLITVLYAFFDNFFIELFIEDKRVIDIISKYWVLVWSSQVICALAYVYDGLCFGLGKFVEIRKIIGEAALLIFLPLALSSLYFHHLWGIWLGLILLNTYRLVKINRLINRAFV